jgi:CRP-like cAMP-binding protein
MVAPTNRLLAHLPKDVYGRLREDFELVQLKQDLVIHEPGQEITHLYFPLTCMISITVTLSDGRTVETGAVGSREVAGINAFMGGSETTQTEYVVQIAGDALRIAAEPLKAEFDSNRSMRAIMLKYTQAMIAQISQNVACNRLHALDERCARWLLEVSDRVQSIKFRLTQEFISKMLGVTRSSVSRSAAKLKQGNIIDYSAAHIEILDLRELEAASCSCYFVLQQEYDRLLGPI